MELRVTDNYLDPHTNCIPFEDLGMGRMGKMERRLLLTAGAEGIESDCAIWKWNIVDD